MCGWLSCEMVFASRSKRSFSCAFSANSAGRTLMATLRSSRVSRALKTSPIPPAPIGATISYGPRRLPELIVMDVWADSTLFAFVSHANPGSLVRCERPADGARGLDLLRIALTDKNGRRRIAGEQRAGHRVENRLA